MSELVGDFGHYAHQISAQLEGRKTWKTPQRLSFETTEHNFRTLLAFYPQIASSVGTSPVQVQHAGDEPALKFRKDPRDYQLLAFHKLKALRSVALFSDPGTGKTKTAIDIICYRFLRLQITGVLILSTPKGIHAQWVDSQLPEHMWENVPYVADYWRGRIRPDFMKRPVDQRLQIFSGNIDMLNSEKAFGILQTFCNVHKDKLLVIIDESSSIKSISAKRSKKLRELVAWCGCYQRLIMTGTPIAKDLTDEWAQFYFLDPNIIGHKYQTSFRAQFCIMGGFENRHIVGHKNLEHFKALTAPYIFRAKKSELNLPPKIYKTIEFELSTEQKNLIRDIRDTMVADLGGGKISAAHAAAAILRISQISCGFASVDGRALPLSSNPRIDAMRSLLQHIEGKVIIWCRFKHDIAAVGAKLPGRHVAIYGDTPDKERIENKQVFILNPDVPYFVATPDAAGLGFDGLQTVCQNAIYFSNGYNAILRWQSEDRIDRIGSTGASSFFDIVGRGSPDRAILRNLRNKKTLSTLVLDDMKELIKEIDNE